MTNNMTEYLVSGEFGPTAGDYCEEIITAKTPEEAKYYFIRSMQKNPYIWERMGENNVHVREYVPAKVRKELSGVLTRDWDPDGHTLADYHLKITYKRLETDAEYDKRLVAEDKKAAKLLASAKKVIASKETKERKEYARLKKKFGDT